MPHDRAAAEPSFNAILGRVKELDEHEILLATEAKAYVTPLRRRSPPTALPLQSGQERPQVHRQQPPQMGVAGVAAGQQDDGRRRSETLDQTDEIAVFCNKHCARVSRRVEDRHVVRTGKAKRANLKTRAIEGVCDPTREGRRQVVVQPDRHTRSATIMG